MHVAVVVVAVVRSDELNLVGVSVVVADGGVDPTTTGWVGVNDGHGEGVFVGMLTIGSLNDRRHQRLSRVQHDECFDVVLDGIGRRRSTTP